jgi:non-ribosomal peptide synthetase component E (peptide arylation enzyme)
MAEMLFLESSSPPGFEPDELRTSVHVRLANYKIPKKIHVLDELPVLPIGKVDKKALEGIVRS